MKYEKYITHVKNVFLFFAAPFIGLIYILLFPLIGIGMLVWMGAKAARDWLETPKVEELVTTKVASLVGVEPTTLR